MSDQSPQRGEIKLPQRSEEGLFAERKLTVPERTAVVVPAPEEGETPEVASVVEPAEPTVEVVVESAELVEPMAEPTPEVITPRVHTVIEPPAPKPDITEDFAKELEKEAAPEEPTVKPKKKFLFW